MAESKTTVADLADLLGVSSRTIRDLAQRGIVVRAGRGAYDLKASVRRYCAHLRDLATGKAGGEAVAVGAATARKRLAEAQADKVEIANAHARGALVDAGEVEREWSGMLRMVRANMLAVPSRCGARLPHLTAFDVGEIDREVRDALTVTGEDRAYPGGGAQ